VSTPSTHAAPAAGAPGFAALSERLDWQQVLFAERPEHRSLLSLRASWPLAPVRIAVHRNHAVEPALSAARPFIEYSGMAPEWLVGDYDDSLSFMALEPADVELIWLDCARLSDRLAPTEIARWLGSRVAALRARSSAPILVMDWDGPNSGAAGFAAALELELEPIADVHVADRSGLLRELGETYFDPEREAVTGTRMSRVGSAYTARELGRWLPALLGPRLKAVVVDLDNTLYHGVLGEDGSDGVVLTDGHAALHHWLIELHASGMFLGLLSRNEPEDVDALFRDRADFPLRAEHFDAHSIGWEDKSTGLCRIAESLRIAPGSILFVDDNAGELLETMLRLPDLHCLHADTDARVTARGLTHYPGVWSFSRSTEDALRSGDLRANETRSQLLALADDDEASYFRELGVTLSVAHDRPEQLPRISELSGKTNQFNLALRRYTEGDLRALLDRGDHQLATVRLQDRLSDSGIIAIAVAERRGDALVVHELCISCRALGRRLEDLIVAQMLAGGPLFDGASEVRFAFRDGPRNGPARRWLSEFTGEEVGGADLTREFVVDADRIIAAASNPNVTIAAVP
jgi:FkbH-like protein